MFSHSSREKHGIRWWLHLGTETGRPACIHIEFYWWSRMCGVTLSTDDEGWNLSLRLPPLALYVSLEGLGLWQPKRLSRYISTPTLLPDRREFDVYVHDWCVRFSLWGRWGEWNASDPWWIRGVSLDLKRLVLGRLVYEHEEVALVPCHVPMPEGQYPAVAKIELVTRGRTRWFKRVGQEVWLNIPKGIPHAGKGENSWDCGDDGLFGIGGASIDDAIRRAQESVTRDRERYGHASDRAMREALL